MLLRYYDNFHIDYILLTFLHCAVSQCLVKFPNFLESLPGIGGPEVVVGEPKYTVVGTRQYKNMKDSGLGVVCIDREQQLISNGCSIVVGKSGSPTDL